MNKNVVRIKSIEIKNFKNVKFGKVEVANNLLKENSYTKADILGIYGQNGSGKTAIIDVLYYLQHIIMGRPIDNNLKDYIAVASDSAEINIEFNVFSDDISYDIGYFLKFAKSENNAVYVVREYMNFSKITADNKSNKTVFIDFKYDDKDNVFTPAKRFDELISINKEFKTDLLVAKKLAEKSNTSYIFNEANMSIYEKACENNHELSKLILIIYKFMVMDLFVINNMHSGVISANLVLPMAFKVNNNNQLYNVSKGELGVSLVQPTVLAKDELDILNEVIEQINTVLKTIIPRMTIGIKNYGPQLIDNGKEGSRIELISIRGNNEIPIRMESDGIIKIISILNALIHAFSDYSVCLAIDELDSGIYEYMLGEILSVFNQSAKGQLIFTSHNLRALEMLNKENIMFSTANENNRYIHMKNIKKTNNLRDSYLRSITLGGQNEVIYEETDRLDMARAFRKAGRKLRDE